LRWDSTEFRDWLRQPTAWAILVVGVVLSLFAWRSLRQEVEDAAQASFSAGVAEARGAIQTRLRGYEIVLSGLQGLFHAGAQVDHSAFSRYAASISAEHGARIRSLSYAQYLRPADKAAYERTVHRVTPAGERSDYLVLQFVEPRGRNEAGLGLDLLSDPERRAAFLRARDTGAIVATPPFMLVSEPGSGNAMSLRLPVYRQDQPMNSYDARQQAWLGVVSITFVVRELVEDVLSATPLHLRVVDAGDTVYEGGRASAGAEIFQAASSIDVGGRPWQLLFSATPGRFRTAGDVAMPWLALVGGLLITVLLTGLVGSLTNSSRRAQRLAIAITGDLRRSQSALAESQRRLIMEHAVTRVLAEADSVSSGLQGMLRAICEAEQWDCGRYFALDVRAGLLRYAESWGIAHEKVTEFIERTRDMTFAPGEGLAGRAWQSGEPIWTADISNDPRATRRYASDFGIRGSFVFPVQSAGRTFGVAAFASRVVREPDPPLIEAVRAIGSQVGQFLIRKQAEEALRFVATHDSLTRLPNRVMFVQRLEHAISQAQRHGRRLAVLFIDLDRFKSINDSLGHDAGDSVLRDVARRLTDGLRASDTVARLGGDEFVVLLEEVVEPLFVGNVALKLIDVLAQPFTLGGRQCRITASIGASLYPDDGGDAQELLKNADTAMYRAKEEGRNAFRAYSREAA